MKTPCLVALGLVLCATSAWASVGTAPVEILNGTVALTCTNANRILARGASGGVACVDTLPAGTIQKAVTIRGTAYSSSQYQLQTFSSGYISNVATADHAPIGCALNAAGFLAEVDVVTHGEATCKKAASAIAIGDRVMPDPVTFGSVKTAGVYDTSIGVAMETKVSGDATIKVLVGADVAGDPVTVPVVNLASDLTCDVPTYLYTGNPTTIGNLSVTVPSNGVVVLTGYVTHTTFNGTGTRNINLGIYRGATLLKEFSQTLAPGNLRFVQSVQWTDSTAGTNTYNLKVTTSNNNASTSSIEDCALTAVAAD